MPSGFIYLADGRAFARRWIAYDAVLRAIATHIECTPEGTEFKNWLLSQLPGNDDEEELGYGAWQRRSDQQVIRRVLDVRGFTPHNQQIFGRATLAAGEAAKTMKFPNSEKWLRDCLIDMADMALRTSRGEPPLSKSDCQSVTPFDGAHIGPGW